MERQPGVDDVLDDDDVTACERDVDVLQKSHPPVTAFGIRCELHDVERVRQRDGSGQVGEEDDTRLQGRYEQEIAALVVRGDLCSERGDARRDLLARQVHGPDAAVLGGEHVRGHA